jgi:peptidoglycan hydrolase-like protein with peptidoglycan-binding domain
MLIMGATLLLASCGGDGALAPSTTLGGAVATTTTPVLPDTTAAPAISISTTTTLPAGPPMVTEGDKNETVEAFQFLLTCNGFGDLEVDGAFGPATRAAVETAQRELGRAITGAPDEDTLVDLSRACIERRRIDDPGSVVGNAAPDDPEVYAIALLEGSALSAEFTQGTGLTLRLLDANGGEVEPSAEATWEIEASQDYRLEVGSPAGPITFTLSVEVGEGEEKDGGEAEAGDWILATDGVIYKGTKLALGSNAQTVIDKVFDFLGHGVRGSYDEFDTGWYSITDPGDMGLRGIFIEGFAFLFFGPDPNNPNRPETFRRHRFEGPSKDADGNPRPDNYATTAEGITVGNTLAELKASYGDGVKHGSNSEEHYYRFTDSGGELCFYFDTSGEPVDTSPIVEIASECRD